MNVLGSRSACFELLFVISLVAVICCCCGVVHAQTAGTRHRIDVAISAEPGSPLLRKPIKGTLSFSVRLSANSLESRYFGVISPSFADVSLVGRPGVVVAPTKIWEEDKCHQRRGLPKVTVLLVKGVFGEGEDRWDVWSAVRHIGLKVPSDELTPGIKLPDGIDQVGAYYALRAQSKETRLNVDLKIYAFDCRVQNEN